MKDSNLEVFAKTAKLEQKKRKLINKLNKLDKKLDKIKKSNDFDPSKLLLDEKYRVQIALYLNDGHRKNAANSLGMNERTFYRRLQKYDVS